MKWWSVKIDKIIKSNMNFIWGLLQLPEYSTANLFLKSFQIIHIHKSIKFDVTFNSLIWSVTMIVAYFKQQNPFTITLTL